MTSYEKRREVAARLRATKAECESRDYPWMVEDLLQALGFKRYEDAEEGIFKRLADLIDRPTCKRLKNDLSYWRCSNCRAFVRCDAVSDLTGVRPASYCPNCGAMVTD